MRSCQGRTLELLVANCLMAHLYAHFQDFLLRLLGLRLPLLAMAARHHLDPGNLDKEEWVVGVGTRSDHCVHSVAEEIDTEPGN